MWKLKRTELEESEESGTGDNVGSSSNNTLTGGNGDPEEVEHLEDGSYQHGDDGTRDVVGSRSLLLDTDDIDNHLGY